MTDRPDWLPALLTLAQYDGDWSRYVKAVYQAFHDDFIASQPKYKGGWVRTRRDPMSSGKEWGFWHCVSEGNVEDDRVPDLRRCERIRWVRAIIENHTDSQIDVWVRNDGRRGRKVHLWFGEEYLVVLGERQKGRRYQLITAFCTDRGHTVRKMRRERDRHRNG